MQESRIQAHCNPAHRPAADRAEDGIPEFLFGGAEL